jgi:TRAP-type C4-dicarboxylate transport system permease small subunit
MKKIAAVLTSIENMLSRINVVIVAACSVLLFLFMLMEVSDVTGRYVFSWPVPGTREIGELVLAWVVFMGWAAVLANKQHIRVLLLVERLPLRVQAWLELLALFIGLVMIGSIAYYSFDLALQSYVTKEVGFTYDIPRWPGKLALFLGSTLFAIQLLITLLNHLFTMLSGRITEENIPTVSEQM